MNSPHDPGAERLNASSLCWLMIGATISRGRASTAQGKQQGCAPARDGQVEGITDKEVAGAVKCVAPHPTDANILYIGAVNGGIWRSTNATSANPSWSFISTYLPSQSIGALVFDPTDLSHQTLVAGTGRFSSFGKYGAGIYGIFRTTTGTGPWANIDQGGIFMNRDVTGIAARGAVILVATNNGGIWRTENTGGRWTQVSGAVGTGLPAGNSYALAADPHGPGIFYTNAGTSGIYKSTNAGATWVKVSNSNVETSLASSTKLKLA